LLVPAIALGRARRYLLDFVPLAALLFIYSESRGLAHILHPHPYYAPQMALEKFVFLGHTPTVALQHWLWTGHLRWYDHVFVQMLRVHFIVPPALGFVLWVKRRALFYRFAATLISLSFVSAVTFLAYPAAPPWAASHALLIPNVTRLNEITVSSVPSGGHGSVSLSRFIISNPYAAIPSLHGGYAFLVFLFVAALAWRSRWRWHVTALAALYPLVQSFAVVYTANHYVVDIMIGFAYATALYFGVRALWRRLGLPE
jgi:hypothetical protein